MFCSYSKYSIIWNWIYSLLFFWMGKIIKDYTSFFIFSTYLLSSNNPFRKFITGICKNILYMIPNLSFFVPKLSEGAPAGMQVFFSTPLRYTILGDVFRNSTGSHWMLRVWIICCSAVLKTILDNDGGLKRFYLSHGSAKRELFQSTIKNFFLEWNGLTFSFADLFFCSSHLRYSFFN